MCNNGIINEAVCGIALVISHQQYIQCTYMCRGRLAVGGSLCVVIVGGVDTNLISQNTVMTYLRMAVLW